MPDGLEIKGDLAVDTEAMGLNNYRDRLCVIQLSNGNGDTHIVHFPEQKFSCPNLKRMLSNNAIVKLFHFGRFDIAILMHYLQIELQNIYCTKIASRLVRTYTDCHGLKYLCEELLKIKLNKHQQSSDWGTSQLSQEQLAYAAGDVLYLHALRDKLNVMLKREGRMDMANECFNFLPTRAKLDLMGWPDFDIFQY